jgi:hypothetical protein
MSNNYGVVEVIHKPTGEKRLIKWDRFHPDIHKQIGEVRSQDYALVYGQPVHIQIDDIGVALASAAKKQEEAAKQMAEKVEAAAVKEVAAPEKTVDSEDIQAEPEADDLEKLPMAQVRKMAKAKGIKYLPTDKRKDLVAKIKDTNISNP